MSVTSTIQLGKDAVPSSGTAVLTRTALGGNGFSAPASMYALRNFAINGDSGGGQQTLTVIMDPTYCTMIGYASMQIDVSAQNRAVHWQYAGGPAVPAQFINVSLTRVDNTVFGAQICHTWMPPSFISPGGAANVPSLVVSVLNIDTEILNLNAIFFLFDIRARESAAYAHLIAARGAMYTSGDA